MVNKKISSTVQKPIQKRPTREVKGKKLFKSKDKTSSSSSDFPEETAQTSPDSVRERQTSKSPEPKLKPRPTTQNIKISRKSSDKTPKKPRKSSKSSPDTSAGPLSNKTIVITGVFKNYSREMLTDLLKSHGAKVTNTVSSRTTHLVHGQLLEDGRNFTAGVKYKKAVEFKKEILSEEDLEKLLKTFTKGPEKIPQKTQIRVSNELLTEKYKPNRLKDLIGNRNVVKKLKEWLKEWDNNNLHTPKSPKTKAPAALISGPPGIGKTIAARLVGQKFGYLVTETNSSDSRSKSLISPLVAGTSVSNSVDFHANIQKTLIIMDEVDGMAGGDKGGMAALVSMIKSTKVPIICICNERQSPKLKTLAKYCLELKFSKPNKLQVVKKLKEIFNSEGMEVESNAIEVVVESCANDIRQILTIFDVWGRESTHISYMDAKNSSKIACKDTSILLNFFEAGSKLFNSNEMRQKSHKEKLDLAFIDYQMVPLIVHDTYLQALDNEDLISLSEAADSLSLSDQLGTEVFKKGNWTLLPMYLQESCIHPSALCKNFIPFTRFPEYFAKNSVISKHQKYVFELKNALKCSAACDSVSIVTEFGPMAKHLISNTFKSHNPPAAANILHDLNLTPELLNDHLASISQGPSLSSNQKKQLLAAFNAHYTSSLKKSLKTQIKPESDPSDSSSSEEISLSKETFPFA